MKKLIIFLFAAILSFSVMPVRSFATPYGAGTLPAPKPAETTESAEAKAVMLRLHEIKAMDKKNLIN